VLQFGIWNIVCSLAYVESWQMDFNLDLRGHAHYFLLLEFPTLLMDLCPFVTLFSHTVGKVLILDGCWNSFWASPQVCVELDLEQKLPPFFLFASLMELDNRSFGTLIFRMHALFVKLRIL
jgi:hypothetical protein